MCRDLVAKSLLMLLLLCTLMVAPPQAGAADGRTAWNNACRTCHSLKVGDNRLGPTLAGVIGRRAGSLPGFPYSPSLEQSAIVWDEATLNAFIESPDRLAPGHRMRPYGGIADPAVRAAIIAFLRAAP
jgi:cytochrome c